MENQLQKDRKMNRSCGYIGVHRVFTLIVVPDSFCNRISLNMSPNIEGLLKIVGHVGVP